MLQKHDWRSFRLPATALDNNLRLLLNCCVAVFGDFRQLWVPGVRPEVLRAELQNSLWQLFDSCWAEVGD
eukprot:15454187-Alexandrium_andersonii.AAC.1